VHAEPEGRRSLGRPRGRWEDNIKMDLGERGWGYNNNNNNNSIQFLIHPQRVANPSKFSFPYLHIYISLAR
jgi:hypothetical protein